MASQPGGPPPLGTAGPGPVAQIAAPAAPSLESLGQGEGPNKKRKTTEQLHFEQYVTRDALQAAAFKDHTDRHIAFLRQKRQEIEYYESLRLLRQTNPGAVFGDGYSAFGNGITGVKPSIVSLRDRRRLGRLSRELRVSKEQMQHQSDMMEHLVPVRLDLEFDKGRLRDTFTWNLHDRTVPLDVFAENLCEDYSFPLSNAQQIAKSIAEQVSDYQPHVFDPTLAKSVDPTLPYTAYKDDDMRVVIKLDITVGQHNLVDQFEWDMNDPQNSPEEFASKLCEELSLPSEFLTAIAHSIREQTQLFTRSLFLVGHPFDGRPVEDDEIRREMCPSITEFIRPKHLVKDFTPMLYELTEAELGKVDKDSERESRWKRRQGRTLGRRGGVVLPDLREPMRTFRTPIVNTVLPAAIDRKVALEIAAAEHDDERHESSGHHHNHRRTRHTSAHAHTHTPVVHQPVVSTPVRSHIATPSPSPSSRLIVKLKGQKIKEWMLSNSVKLVGIPSINSKP
ncbi:hypothetical protein V1511DRAFT_494666 [Dipodascopsis uninucleata]